jgi:hypothetical protein
MSVLRQLLTRSTLWIALLVLIGSELALRYGLNEWLVSPDSYAGQTIRKVMALEHIDQTKPTLATLGSSVAVYGLDHERLAQIATQHGANHVNLSTPGAQLLALRAWARWLPQYRPMRGGIIVTGPDDYKTISNGHYELGIALPLLRRPFHASATDTKLVSTHVFFDRAQRDTWGQYSLLFAYRSDLADLLANPIERARRLAWWWLHRSNASFAQLRVTDDIDVCGLDLSTPAACLSMQRPGNYPQAEFTQIQRDCQTIAARTHESQAATPLTQTQLQTVRDLRKQVILDLGWRGRTLLLRLPLHPIWQQTDATDAKALRDALHAQVLAEGIATELNLENIFSERGVEVCSVYRDLWHLNSKGQAIVTEAVEPAVQRLHQ